MTEEIYVKLSDIEHPLHRPDMYIGSVKVERAAQWIFDIENCCFINKEIDYNHGLYKIIDELIVNIGDHKIKNPAVSRAQLIINDGAITLINDGPGIPIYEHEQEKVLIPELIFSHFRTSSNYDDTRRRICGGLNGFGAKLSVIFSKLFTLETVDSERGLKFTQTYSDNLKVRGHARVTKCTSKASYTSITLRPDYERFGYEGLSDDMGALIMRRFCDLGAIFDGKISLFINKKKVMIKSFNDYVKMYNISPSASLSTEIVAGENFRRWDIRAAVISDAPGLQHISFVNGVYTSGGGAHVEYIANSIIAAAISDFKKAAAIKPKQARQCLFLFINCYIDDPTFESQSKKELTTRSLPRIQIPAEFTKKLLNGGLTAYLNELISSSELKEIEKSDKNLHRKKELRALTNLDDAKNADTNKYWQDCYLIVTEGSSAKSSVISGLKALPRETQDMFGVFPLRGKLINTRNQSATKIAQNKEIDAIKKIMGLEQTRKYEWDTRRRYGRIMICADQDEDGSHIKGLIINFFHTTWPDLLAAPQFLSVFKTPLLKLMYGSPRTEISFYSKREYQQWLQNKPGTNITPKFYKGLGTSTSKEFMSYFKNLSQHQVQMICDEKTTDSIVLAFDKNCAAQRKNWLKFVNDNSINSTCQMTYTEFINNELIQFSHADNLRSIPHIMDGLKPSLRKIIHVCLKHPGRIKVAQLGAKVAELTQYHHGEVSLFEAIIGMAQNFVGSNNMELLVPDGQFGTRLEGGKDHAAPRYIFTQLSPCSIKLFHKIDLELLEYIEEDNEIVEPKFFVPVLPLLLINGSTGIGTGYSCDIPSFNPEDIKRAIIQILNNAADEEIILNPYYRGFKGSWFKHQNKFYSKGIYTRAGAKVHVTELPVGTWTQSFKDLLESKDYNSISSKSDVDIDFVIQMPNAPDLEKKTFFGGNINGVEHELGLYCSHPYSNMHAYNINGVIIKYETPLEILKEFVYNRMKYYSLRKLKLIEKIRAQILKLEEKIKFMIYIAENGGEVLKMKKKDLEDIMISKLNIVNIEYLCSLPIHSLTGIDEVKNKINILNDELNKIIIISEQDMYLIDLQTI